MLITMVLESPSIRMKLLDQRAVAHGYVDGQGNVGMCYLNGDGLRKDDAEAVGCNRIAAEKGVANAQYS